jgi:hypothetical protein
MSRYTHQPGGVFRERTMAAVIAIPLESPNVRIENALKAHSDKSIFVQQVRFGGGNMAGAPYSKSDNLFTSHVYWRIYDWACVARF